MRTTIAGGSGHHLLSPVRCADPLCLTPPLLPKCNFSRERKICTCFAFRRVQRIHFLSYLHAILNLFLTLVGDQEGK